MKRIISNCYHWSRYDILFDVV